MHTSLINYNLGSTSTDTVSNMDIDMDTKHGICKTWEYGHGKDIKENKFKYIFSIINIIILL